MKIFKKIREFKNFFLFLLFIVFWILIFSMINMEAVTEKISAGGSYAVAFVVALFGGVSVFTSSSYLATLVVLSMGPANPFFLALCAGTALTLGDMLFYFFGSKGRQSLPPAIVRRIDKFSDKLAKQKKAVVYMLVYIYTGLTPLPADLLMFALSFGRYPFRKIILPLYLGNITLVLVIYYMVRTGIDFVGP